jgi:hypothetical protein
MLLVLDNIPIPNLKWKSFDISLRYLACGTSTGSIYLYRRRGGQGLDRVTIEHLDTAATTASSGSASVELCRFSPDERKLAVGLSSGNLLIIDLHLNDSRRKPQVVQKCTPHKDFTMTTMCWLAPTPSTTSLVYVGTKGGHVVSISVADDPKKSSGLAKLHSMVAGTKLNHVCELDSEIVQLEVRRTGELIASTLTRCVVLIGDNSASDNNISGTNITSNNRNNNSSSNSTSATSDLNSTTHSNGETKEGASTTSQEDLTTTQKEEGPKQIGKKLRNGYYGACFCSYSDPAARIAMAQLAQGLPSTTTPTATSSTATLPMLMYAARPGKRIWLANASNQKVLVTLKLKNKMPNQPSMFLGKDAPRLSTTSTNDSFEKSTATKDFSKLSTFRTNAGDGEPDDVLMSWNNAGVYFISTDISAPENVKVLQIHQSLGNIDQLIVCRGDCYESGHGFFVLHTSKSNVQHLSRVMSLSPMLFLSSYHAEDTSLIKCIRIAVNSHIMDHQILERLNSRLEASPLLEKKLKNNEGSEDAERDDAGKEDRSTLQKFLEVLEGVRATVVKHERPATPMEEVEENGSENVTQRPSETVNTNSLPIEEFTAPDAPTTATSTAQSEASIFPTINDMSKSVISMWSKKNIEQAKRRYRVYALSIIKGEKKQDIIPLDIPNDIQTIEQLKDFFILLTEHLQSLYDESSSKNLTTFATTTATNNNNDINSTTSTSTTTTTTTTPTPINDATSFSWSTSENTVIDASNRETTNFISAENVDTAVPNTNDTSAAARKQKKRKKKKKKRERLASLEDLDSTVLRRTTYEIKGNNHHTSSTSSNLSNMAANAMKRATDEAVKVAKVLKEKTSRKSGGLSPVTSPVTSPILRPKNEPVDVGKALQMLQPESNVPWTNLRTAGIKEHSTNSQNAASQVAADPTLKNLDSWLTQLRKEESNRDVFREEKEAAEAAKQKAKTDSSKKKSIVSTSISSTKNSSGVTSKRGAVNGAMQLIQQGLSMAQTITAAAAAAASFDVNVLDNEEDHLSITTFGIPNNLRGKRHAQVEYEPQVLNIAEKKSTSSVWLKWKEQIGCSGDSSSSSNSNSSSIDSSLMFPFAARLLRSAVTQYIADGTLLPEECQNDSEWVTTVFEQMCLMTGDVEDNTCARYVGTYHASLIAERAAITTFRYRPSLIAETASNPLHSYLFPHPTDDCIIECLGGSGSDSGSGSGNNNGVRNIIPSIVFPPWRLLQHLNAVQRILDQNDDAGILAANFYNQLPVWVMRVGVVAFVQLVKTEYQRIGLGKKDEIEASRTFLLINVIRRLTFVEYNSSSCSTSRKGQQYYQKQLELVKVCQRNHEFIKIWCTLELEVNRTDKDTILKDIILSKYDRTQMVCLFNEKQMLKLFEDMKYINGMHLMLSRCKWIHQRISVKQGLSSRSEHHPRNINMLQIAARAVQLIEKCCGKKDNDYMDQMTTVFECVSSVVDSSTTVALLEELHAKSVLEPSKTVFALPALRGILYGGGSSYALNVIECSEPSFRNNFDSSIFSEIIQFDSLFDKRKMVSRRLVSGLDKYLWTRKPSNGLPPQLRALRQCERLLSEAAEDMKSNGGHVDDSINSILMKLPNGVRKALLDNVKEEKEGVGGKQLGRVRLGGELPPVWFEDEGGGDWGTKLTLNLDKRKNKFNQFLYCEVSGDVVESGHLATVFPCGHVVSTTKKFYNMCPMCPFQNAA